MSIATAALLLLATASPAHAQSASETGAARDLFAAGLEAAREQRWEEARQAFERSLAIMERPSTLLNLAGAQAETGRVVAAAGSYRRFLELAQSGRDARLRPQAEAALRAVEARIPSIGIVAVGLLPQDEVRLDAQPVDIEDVIPLDPGAHEIVVTRSGAVVAHEPFTVGEGERRTIAVEVRAATVAVPVDVVPVDVGLEAPVDEGGGEDSTWVWVGVGVGVAVLVGVGIGVGIALGTGAPSYYDGNLGDGMITF